MKRKDAKPRERRERFIPFPAHVFPAAAQARMRRGRGKRLVRVQAEALGLPAAMPISVEDREAMERVTRAARRLMGPPR
jgi:hypothetical protein